MKYISFGFAILAITFASACSTPSAPPAPTAVPAATIAPTPPLFPSPTRGGVGGEVATMNIDIKLFTYKPDLLQVKAGTTIVWTNQDGIEHSVTNGSPPTPAGAFDSGLFTQGKTFSFKFDKPGDYAYFCTRHNSLLGRIQVVP